MDAGERCWLLQCAITANKLPPVAGTALLASRKIRECHTMTEVITPRIARQHRFGQRIYFRYYEWSRGATQSSENPFDLSGNRKEPRAA